MTETALLHDKDSPEGYPTRITFLMTIKMQKMNLNYHLFLSYSGFIPCYIVLLANTFSQTALAQTNVPNNLPNIEQVEPKPTDLPSDIPPSDATPTLKTPNAEQNANVQCLTTTTGNESILVKQIEVSGNSIFSEEINAFAKPFLKRKVSFEDLLCLRSQITQLYFDSGYVTSGAFITNNQDISQGKIKIQVVEGEIEDIQISGLNRLQAGYVRSRLKRASRKPLNQRDLQEGLELLQLDPLLERVNAELTVGSGAGRNILKVSLKESPAFHAGIGFNNYRSPSIGSTQGNVFVSHDNLLGFGDRFSAQYGITEGLDIYDISYTIPWNANDGTIGVRYGNSDSTIVEDRFRDFDIDSETEDLSFILRQPIVKKPDTEFALGLSLDLRRTQTSLLGEPFSFSLGPDNGESKVAVLRFTQDWVNRSRDRVLAARSQFSFGLDAFDATINDTGTDGRFFSWLGQFQWVEQVSPRALLVSKITTQLTPDSLLPIEQFGIGGVDTVRGYRQNQLVADNGVLFQTEVRLPLTANPETFQLVPFFEIGTVWNNNAPQSDPSTIAGIGLGARWAISRNLGLRLDYGIPLIDANNSGNSLHEKGLYFSLQYQPF
jgi:hemolysin activation/secretion protein